jgi:hypothetical protein
MSDPRHTDSRYNDSWNHYSMLREEPVRGGWIVSLSAMVLIAAVIIAGVYFKPNQNSANNNLAPIIHHGGPTQPNLTGSGSTSPQPLTPLPR